MSKILARSKNRDGEEGKGTMLKIEDKDSKKGYSWYFMTEDVTGFVNVRGIKSGCDIEFTAEEIKGEETITRIEKYTGADTGSSSQFKCKNCGKELKDNKYETCYDCSMKARKEEESSPEGQAKQESIRNQTIGKMVAMTIQGLDGIDLNNVLTVIDTLYKKYQEIVK